MKFDATTSSKFEVGFSASKPLIKEEKQGKDTAYPKNKHLEEQMSIHFTHLFIINIEKNKNKQN